jgi:hypothetical protein
VDELRTLKMVLAWFLAWREESFQRVRESRPAAGIRLLHSKFLTREASDDFISMLTGMIGITMTYATRDRETNHLTYFIPRSFSQDSVENQFARYRLGLAHMRFTSVALATMHRRLGVESVISAVGHKAMEARNAGADSEEIESILGIDQEIAAIHEHVKKCRALFSKPRVVIAEDGTPSIQVEYYGR